MKKIVYTLVLVFILTGCKKNLNIRTEYDSVKLEIVNIMNAGCHDIDKETYFTHNIHDKHTYNFDYINDLEYIITDHWLVYNLSNDQYISGDLGVSYSPSNGAIDNFFEKNYRDDLIRIIKYIDDGKKTEMESKNDLVSFEVNFNNEKEIFEIVKKFGTINIGEELNDLKAYVTLEKNNITKIVFNIKSKNEDNSTLNCYTVEWNLSNFEQVNIQIPEIIK